MMTAKEMLERSLALLDHGRTWIKHAGRSERGFCALGALIQQTDFSEESNRQEDLAIKALVDSLPNEFLDQYMCGITIATFNDAPVTTYKDVKKLFEDAIERCPG
jgi:hypothetical protein